MRIQFIRKDGTIGWQEEPKQSTIYTNKKNEVKIRGMSYSSISRASDLNDWINQSSKKRKQKDKEWFEN